MSKTTTISVTTLLVSLIIYNIRLISCQSSSTTTTQQGEWHLLHESIGISAMHMQLLHNNKIVIFDRTDFGPSNISLPENLCRYDSSDTALQTDCTAHSILYDLDSNTFRPLTVLTDTWCSSGSVLPDGTLVQTGGFNDGDHVVRTFTPCGDNSCDWLEFPGYLAERRWYATNQILPDGHVIIIGGRKQFNYEFYPHHRHGGNSLHGFRFLRETTDRYSEDNLYPFVHLLPDGNLFIFANTRSVLFDYRSNHVIKDLPSIPGGDPRNYPSSGSSVLLPLDENQPGNIEAEVMICGGAPSRSFYNARSQGTFLRALYSCGRLRVTDQNPNWFIEEMPVPRVMGDMLLLPNGHVIIINGAQSGTAGWELGRDPVTQPIIYRPTDQPNQRFSIMASASRPRLYHSTAVLVPDGRVLVGGSNPHVYYNFTGVDYPTDLSLEAFSPPYLSTDYSWIRPRILSVSEVIGHGQLFSVTFTVAGKLTRSSVSVRIVAPSFTTHSFAMNQRMVVLKSNGTSRRSCGNRGYEINVVGPSRAEIAPSGYYMLFVVHEDVPSPGTWVRVSDDS